MNYQSSKNQQNYYPTDYYLTTPNDKDFINNHIHYYGNLHMAVAITDFCPFYAPVVFNGNCRHCYSTPDVHMKYFSYSMYASKIQRWFFRYKFKKIISNNLDILQKNYSHFPDPVLIIKYKYKYYRKWSKYNFEQFVLYCK